MAPLRILLPALLAGAAVAADPYVIAASAPRLLVNDAAVLAELRRQLSDGLAPATRFRDMVLGEIADPGSRYGFSAYFAALMYQVTGTASYASFAHDRIMTFIAGEEALIAAGQRAVIAGDSYLEVGPLLGDVMLTLDWCPGQFTAGERARIIAYANQTLANLWNPAGASWGGVAYPWSGWSLDNPANNYYYSFLTATMMAGVATYGDNPQAQAWIDKFRAKIDQLDTYFDANLAGGGSQEGTGYGTAMMNLFRVYYYWQKSTGENLADRSTHALNSAYWLLHATTPDSRFLAPTGDHARESSAALYDYHRTYLLALLTLHPGDPGARCGLTLLAQSGISAMANSMNYWSDWLFNQPDITALPLATLSTAFYDPFTGVFASRSGWDSAATYLYHIAGPFTESHAHQDQGSFVLWKGGWLFDDENIRSHSGLNQQPEAHNLVRFTAAGATVPQRVGGPETRMLAVADNAVFSYTACDLTPVYDGAAAVVLAQRELLFLKPGCLVVFDRADAGAAGVARVFSLNMASAPTIAGERLGLVRGGHRADCWRLAPAGLPWTTTAYTDAAEYPGGGVRAEASHASGTGSRFLHVIGVDGDVAAVAASDAAGETGAALTFADGRTATVRFRNAGPGGSLDLRTAGGTVLHNAALPATVVKPPLLAAAASAPPVVSAASATPATVAATTSALAASASDDGGEAALTYSWSASPATATISPNGSNAAKAATATFAAAGSYALTVTVRDVEGQSASRSVAVTVAQTATTLSAGPASAAVAAGARTTLQARVLDQFGNAIAAAPLTWAVVAGGAGGSVDAAGVYTAPATPGSDTVRASSGALSGSVAVTVTAAPAGGGGGGGGATPVIPPASGVGAGGGGGSGGGKCGLGGLGLAGLALSLAGVRWRRRR
ncbi:MAG: Ig-like domain-containing protein [Planctomycetes bacterium]|nr:Ig-like domain-containing protein [Planctomycetota bacterium]